ncbi:MAG: hypothetical protein M3131_00635 [Actinomycetota bacterium]|nr:hypothetical protein [Actinomycetota bacterium]
MGSADGISQREIGKWLAINYRTVTQMLALEEPPRYRRAPQGSMLRSLER